AEEDSADEELTDPPTEGEAPEPHERNSVTPSEPAGGFYPEPFDSAPVTTWEAPVPPADSAAAEASEAPEPHEEHEPTLAAWQEEWHLQGERTAQRNLDQENADTAAVWDEAHADHTGSPASEPDSIALRVAEESVVAAEISDAATTGNGAESETGSVE